MRKARAATAAAPKPNPRARAKPKAKPSPASLSGVSSPSGGASPGADLSFLSPSSPAKPKPRSPLAAASPFAAPASMSTVGDLRSLAASHMDSLKRRFDALHGDSVRDLEASHSRISKRFKVISAPLRSAPLHSALFSILTLVASPSAPCDVICFRVLCLDADAELPAAGG